MSIGDWVPESDVETLKIDPTWLQQCIAISADNALDDMENRLAAEDIRNKAAYMRADAQQWQAAVDALRNDELLHLIRFFTRAEMLLSGWEAGKHSPVITLTRLLRQRGQKLSREMLLWIRQNSDNRFLPNGGL